MNRPEEILNVVLPFAQQMLEKNREFYPFGASIKINGEIFTNMGDVGKENPLSQEIIDFLYKNFSEEAQRNEILTAAICYDTKIGEDKKDAICIKIEDKDSQPTALYLPYKKNLFGQFKYGELIATVSNSIIFPKIK